MLSQHSMYLTNLSTIVCITNLMKLSNSTHSIHLLYSIVQNYGRDKPLGNWSFQEFWRGKFWQTYNTLATLVIWVKYWRMMFILPNLPKLTLAKILCYTWYFNTNFGSRKLWWSIAVQKHFSGKSIGRVAALHSKSTILVGQNFVGS